MNAERWHGRAIAIVLPGVFLLSAAVWSEMEPAIAPDDPEPCWQLVWADEFGGQTVDPEKWEFQLGDGCDIQLCGWGNAELQWYRSENARVEDGQLVITAKRERFRTRDYTSVRLRTLNKADFSYGRLEARMKLPTGQGMWPAFWMLPTDSVYGGWAASGEIDIMEATNIPTVVHGTIHFGGSWPNNVSSSATYRQERDGQVTDFSQDFHVYTLEWEPKEMRWYVDGQLYSTKTEWWSSGGPYPAPFDRRFHLLLNLAVGGRFPGPPDATTVLPQELRVDWVRVYQQGESGDCAGEAQKKRG